MHVESVRPLFILALSFAVVASSAGFSEKPSVVIEVREIARGFVPSKIEAPAGVPIVLRVTNAARERIEFESFKLRVERVVEPDQVIRIALPALRPGRYDFFDDFHDDLPEGVIVVK